MKNKAFFTILFLSLVVSLASFTVFANDAVVTVNPFSYIFGNYNADYEMSINDHQSLLVGGSYFTIDFFDITYNTMSAKAGARFYKDQALEGIYYGPVVSAGLLLSTSKYELLNDNSASLSLSGGGIAGYQWVYKGGFVLDFNLGLEYTMYTDSSLGNDFGPTLGLRFGYKL